MKKTPILLRQHIGWHFIKHWRVQGRKKPEITSAEKILKEKEVPIFKPEDILKEKRIERIELIDYRPKPLPQDENHPNWHNQPLLSYGDNNVLLEGLNQAKILTKTVEIREGLPENMAFKNITRDINNRVKSIILESYIFDAEQKKVPKIKDPERPAWNFPRTYGITQKRKNKLILLKLLQLIESTSNYDLAKERCILKDLFFSFPFEKYGDLFQFQLSGYIVVMSARPLSPVTAESTENLDLPNIDPIKPTITLNKDNIYEVKTVYPIKPHINKIHPHTIFISYDKEDVKNIYEEEVTETQIFGRSLLKSFTASASFARRRYGDDVKLLPEPVTIQAVQTDGQFYHFGIFQLNTLELEGNGIKNVWYQTPLLNLFENCSYILGKPTLEGYNSEVMKHLYAFYNNV